MFEVTRAVRRQAKTAHLIAILSQKMIGQMTAYKAGDTRNKGAQCSSSLAMSSHRLPLVERGCPAVASADCPTPDDSIPKVTIKTRTESQKQVECGPVGGQ